MTTESDGVQGSYPAKTTDGNIVTIIEKSYEGMTMILVDDQGNEYTAEADGTLTPYVELLPDVDAVAVPNAAETKQIPVVNTTNNSLELAPNGESVDGKTFVNEVPGGDDPTDIESVTITPPDGVVYTNDELAEKEAEETS